MRKSPVAVMHTVLTAVALLAAAASVWIAATGGVRFSVFDIDIRALNPYRPLAFAVAALVLRVAIGGAASLRADIALLERACTPRAIAIALVILTVLVGLIAGSDVAGGADQYGYISQADLWLQGDPTIAQPYARSVPWPEAQWTLAPLGYRPSPDGVALVPTYAPGFPLLLALFKYAAGQCAIGWVVPIATGLLIASTFAIGKRAVSADVGAASAWLVSTSPAVLYSMMSPMTDIPAAACWALAIYGCLVGSRSAAALGGVAAAVAVLIRPNLVHVGVLMALWLLVKDFNTVSGWRRVARLSSFGVPFATGCLIVAAVNNYLYGAPTRSGYGSLGELFSPSFVGPNARNYAFWISETQTPFALLGLLAIVVPLARWLKPRSPIEGRSLLAVTSIAVIGTYLFYLNFGEWWYLRFLLPMWPALCVGTASLVTSRSGRSFNRAGIAVLLVLGGYGVWYARDAGAFHIGRNEHRYVRIADLVRDATAPNSVIITLQHSGSLRYYGGRTTLRYEQLDHRWLDRSIAWLHANGFHPYILLDDQEHEPFKQKFAGRNVAGRLDLAVVAEYRDRYNTSTFLYDPLRPLKVSVVPMLVVAPRFEPRGCAPPADGQSVFSLENSER